MIFTTSSFFERTPDRWKNSASSEFAMTRASEVLPQPGGHHRSIDGSRPASMNLRMAFHSPIRCDCPTRSSICSGLRSDASGVMDEEKRDCMRDIVGIFAQKKSLILANKALNILLVPRRRLELLHLAATASKTVMSTIPSPGLFGSINLRHVPLSSVVSLSRRLALGSMAPCGRTSTIPSPGLVLEMGVEPTHP